MPKPSDFFIGLVDFIALLLPGAILGYLLVLLGWGSNLGGLVAPLVADPAAGWAAFLILAYVLGHVLHHLGGFLDEPVYDNAFRVWRRANPGWMIFKVSWDKFATHTPRDQPSLLETRATELLRAQLAALATTLKVSELELDGRGSRENRYGLSDVALRLMNPAAGAELDRAGVDSKFFRSLALVAVAAVVLVPVNLLIRNPITDCWLGVLGSIVLSALTAVFSLYRFCDRRWSAAELTYRYYVLARLAELEKKPAADGATPPASGPSAHLATIRVEIDRRAESPCP